MSAYLEGILSRQTEDIKNIINAESDGRLQRELNQARTELLRERENIRELEKQLEELKSGSEDDRQKLQKQFLEMKILKEKYEDNIRIGENLKWGKAEADLELKQLQQDLEKREQLLDKERQENAEILVQNQVYEKRYLGIEQAYEAYQRLRVPTRQRIEHIFGCGNLYSFIAAAGDWNTIEGIWSFTKRRIIEEETNGLEELVIFFERIFAMYQLFAGNEKYQAIRPDIGSKFDSDLHSIKGIRTDGVISNVLLVGIYDMGAKKVIFKAVVKVQ